MDWQATAEIPRLAMKDCAPSLPKVGRDTVRAALAPAAGAAIRRWGLNESRPLRAAWRALLIEGFISVLSCKFAQLCLLPEQMHKAYVYSNPLEYSLTVKNFLETVHRHFAI
jgi:hypothetical protein